MLRLGHKYNISTIKTEAISRLERCFPVDLKKFKNHWTNADESGIPQDFMQLRLVDVTAVVLVARRHNLPRLLPSAFYLAAQQDDENLVEGYHDADNVHWKLDRHDITACLTGRAQLHAKDIAILTARPSATCSNRMQCSIALKRQRDKHGSKVYDWTSPLKHFITFTDLPDQLCECCTNHLEDEEASQREEIWKDLPKYFQLELSVSDWPALAAALAGEGGDANGE